MKHIEKVISPTFINGHEFQRKVVFEGIQYMEVSNKQAEIIWKVYLIDSDGEIIIHPDIEVGRVLRSPLNNSNFVDSNGVIIDKELIKKSNPINEDETEEAYQSRIDGIYDTKMETGIPEFDFYYAAMAVHPLPVILEQAITLLDSLGRFDRLTR